MNRDPYAIALNNALSEIKKAYPDVKNSFLFTKTGSVISGDQETDETTMNDMLDSIQTMKEKAKVIGDLKSIQINGKNGKLTVSTIDDMYLVMETSKNADKMHIHSITHVILPTILKTLETITSTHLQAPTPKQLVVDTLTGFFAGDSVQIDLETLLEWTKNNDNNSGSDSELTEKNIQEIIDHVRIETFGGNSTLCKVKEINDYNLKGKNMIRIPEKICNSLNIKRGDLVKVKPLL
jgi:predicted regulator of Ras-like GTPase activity (Roadblock/LC7/MglB family)